MRTALLLLGVLAWKLVLHVINTEAVSVSGLINDVSQQKGECSDLLPKHNRQTESGC